MTPPKSPEPETQSTPASARPGPPLWRLAFDLVERPVAAASETFLQSDVFMDALAASWKVQRRMTREMQRGVGLWLDVLAVPRRSDMTTLVNQVASLERQVRQVTRELERRNGSEISAQPPAATTRRSSA
jgi:polyhydroxyalkanoate synthesis regulator phasin